MKTMSMELIYAVIVGENRLLKICNNSISTCFYMKEKQRLDCFVMSLFLCPRYPLALSVGEPTKSWY